MNVTLNPPQGGVLIPDGIKLFARENGVPPYILRNLAHQHAGSRRPDTVRQATFANTTVETETRDHQIVRIKVERTTRHTTELIGSSDELLQWFDRHMTVQ